MIAPFGGQQQPNEGYFFQFDMTYWGVTPPTVHPVGFPSNGRTVWYGPIDTATLKRYANAAQYARHVAVYHPV